MSSVNIGENFLAGLRAPHYANGRLLTAEDLKAEQETVSARLGFTGQAAGAGIISGFDVSQVANNLRVTAGLGINRNGQAVRLVEASAELSLSVLPAASAVTAGDGRFNDCNLAPAQGGALVETGAYLLAVAPVSQLQGSASVKTISPNSSTCVGRWEVEGVQFKALRLADAPARNANNAAAYRNLLANWCFGTEALKTLPQDPFSFPARYSGLDALGEDELTPCDLPLAVFYWDNQTLRFADQWSARRRVTHAFPSDAWHALVADRRVADAQARFLQFQAQVEEMRLDTTQFPDLSTRYGGQDFRNLPPVGFLPIVPSDAFIRRLVVQAVARVVSSGADEQAPAIAQIVKQVKGSIPSARTFRLETFFGSKLPRRIGLVDRETIEFRLNRSWYDEALDFTSLPDVASSEDETVFEVVMIADELEALISGRVNLLIKQRLDDRDVAVFGKTFIDLGATLSFTEARGFQPMLGKNALRTFVGGRQRKTIAPAALPSITPWFDLFDAGTLTNFIQTVQLPPQYAMFVKTVRLPRWIARDFGNA